MRLTLFALLFLTAGCFKDPDLDCTKVDCSVDDPSSNFRIVRDGDGTDLLFGANRAYDPAEILFYAVTGSDTVFFPGVKAQWGQSTGDSVLKVDFPSEPQMVFIRLNAFDTDTLQISYRHFQGNNCCPPTTQVAQCVVNGQLITDSQNMRMQIIRK